MLVLEGADGLGKTAFAHACLKYVWSTKENPPVIYQHFDRPPPQFDHYRHYLPYVTPYTVMDRFHIGELVYGTAFRGGSRVTSDRLRLLDAHLALVGSYVVCFVAGSLNAQGALYRRSCDERPEMYKLDGVLKVHALYEKLMHSGAVVSGGEALRPHVDKYVVVDGTHAYPSSSDSLVKVVCDTWLSRLVMLALLRERKENTLWTQEGILRS